MSIGLNPQLCMVVHDLVDLLTFPGRRHVGHLASCFSDLQAG